MTAFPWAEAMAFGLGRLRLSPDAFWALTPREFAALAGKAGRGQPPGRADLEAMLRRFPDMTESQDGQ